jgi:hypothetical protein
MQKIMSKAMGISSNQLAQMKEALKTKRVKVLLGLGICFVISIYLILTMAFDSIVTNQFEDNFWMLALLEILIAGVAVVICSRYGSLGALKMGGSIKGVMQKLFRH